MSLLMSKKIVKKKGQEGLGKNPLTKGRGEGTSVRTLLAVSKHALESSGRKKKRLKKYTGRKRKEPQTEGGDRTGMLDEKKHQLFRGDPKLGGLFL